MAYTKSWYSRTLTGGIKMRVWSQGGVDATTYAARSLTPSPGYLCTKTGSAVYNYRERIRTKRNASSDYYKTDWVSRKGLQADRPLIAAWRIEPPGNTQTTSGYVFPPMPNKFVPSDDAVVNARALEKFYKKLTSLTTNVDLSKVLAEASQAKAMISDRTMQLAEVMLHRKREIEKYYRYLRFVQHLPFYRTARLLSNVWLEYSFGWAPLIADIAAAQEEINKVYDMPSLKCKAEHRELYAQPIVRVNDSYGIGSWYTIQKPFDAHHVRYSSAVSLSDVRHLRWGLSLGNIPGAIWEATPWSFMVDYFFDVSTWLSSRQFSTISPIYLSKAYRKARNVRCVTLAGPPTIPYKPSVRISQTGYAARDLYVYNRTSLTEFPIYVPPIKLLDAFSWKRGVNIAALGVQKLFPY